MIQLKEIVQKYSNVTVFDNFNLTIDKGFTAIMGPSGCGKSTIFRYITGLQKPTSGEILLDGKPLKSEDTIPMVFQMPSSLEWYSVLKNVELPLILKGVSEKESRERAMEMIKLVGLEDHIGKYAISPQLSGGQLQRVAIARSLVANPSVILMDEPFSALDAVNRRKMQDFLLQLFETAKSANLNPTFVLVTHDSREAAFLADEIYIMGMGTLDYQYHVQWLNRVDIKKKVEFFDLVERIDKTMEA